MFIKKYFIFFATLKNKNLHVSNNFYLCYSCNVSRRKHFQCLMQKTESMTLTLSFFLFLYFHFTNLLFRSVFKIVFAGFGFICVFAKKVLNSVRSIKNMKCWAASGFFIDVIIEKSEFCSNILKLSILSYFLTSLVSTFFGVFHYS